MKIIMFDKHKTAALVLFAGLAVSGVSLSNPAAAQIDMKKRPSLVITNQKTPASEGTYTARTNYAQPTPITPTPATSSIYGGPIRTPDITAAQVQDNSGTTRTVVAGKVDELRSDLYALQGKVNGLSGDLKSMQQRSLAASTEYNASVATINTQLQIGTTPGNPRLVQKLSTAQSNLESLSQNVAGLNSVAVEAANAASMASYLLDACRSAYGLSGAVEEDHAALAQVEDQINNTIVTIDRVLNEVNDDITRTSAYLSAERDNLRTLSLAVTNGDYYGRSLANRPFSNAPAAQPIGMSSGGNNIYPSAGAPVSAVSAMPLPATPPGSGRPLVKIKFDQPNVQYEQAVYMAVKDAFEKYPNARLEMVAVTPTSGNAAQVAIESTRARRNAETVLRSLTQMGIDTNRIDLSTQQSAEAKTNEVHILVR